MKASDLLDEVKKKYAVKSDSELASIFGVTQPRISQLRKQKSELTAGQIASYLHKASNSVSAEALANAIRPVVEFYEIDSVESKQGAKWELLPTGKGQTRNQTIKSHLEKVKGLYFFYDSRGRAIYVGKTEKQNVWKEMTDAYNRERSNHKAFFVQHPSNGEGFSPAWEKPRQPTQSVVYLYDTATYFSVYEVSGVLIPKLEALVVRAFCNTLSNKKMEKF